ncbi:multidrug efflux SMR transporter [Brevibacillus sp. RS1.1]|uniref:DMT family transporter n=1 Tax=Bacillales TaxID=1385 RepID=UPI0003488085|nr:MULTISPECIES: multidrug efflux SMR transporter [Bacillales]KMZ41477.1 transporter [Bacillus sp. FJAT-27238]NRR03364.1 multidrug efflux SMR transporter [Brevibacillus sp. RS1.1]
MGWVYLLLAGVCEVVSVTSIHHVNVGGGWRAKIVLVSGFTLSFLLLSLAMKTIPMGTAYAIWTGIGTAGSTIVCMVGYGESRDWRRMICMSMILFAAVGLKIVS